MAKVLIVDDEKAIRKTLRDILEFEKYIVDEAENGLDCLVHLKQDTYDVVLMDIKMPKMDGMEALDRIQEVSPDTPVVLISGHGNIQTAVDAVKKGAFDYIAKPPDLNRLLITIRNAMDKSSLISVTKSLKKKVGNSKVQEIVGESDGIQKIKNTIEKIAPTEARVLITGGNGTGKELVARWIHEKSSRSQQSIVEVNCAAIPSELIESELFGHEKGSFTSAVKQRIGKFEQAHGGTLFLDEIGDMSLSAQAKVLRALQEHKITRVGGEKDITVDVRIIAATNKNLRKEIEEKRFREDLYHRLAVIIIEVPMLNDRKDDIPLLINHFIENICHDYGTQVKKIDTKAVQLLQKYDWTGNIRELRNVIERLIILSDKSITEDDVNNYVYAVKNPSTDITRFIDQFSTKEELLAHIEEAFKKNKV